VLHEDPNRATTVKVTANGKAFDVDEGVTVATFIRSRDLDPRYVVVEHNGDPLERDRYERVTLAEGDRLELVRAVAGGSA
jgi:sulfur carrier protein